MGVGSSVSEQVGNRANADPAITLRVYAHIVNEQLAEAAAIFAERVEGAA